MAARKIHYLVCDCFQVCTHEKPKYKNKAQKIYKNVRIKMCTKNEFIHANRDCWAL